MGCRDEQANHIAELEAKLAAAKIAELEAANKAMNNAIAYARALIPHLEMGWDESDDPTTQAEANAAVEEFISAIRALKG